MKRERKKIGLGNHFENVQMICHESPSKISFFNEMKDDKQQSYDLKLVKPLSQFKAVNSNEFIRTKKKLNGIFK